MAFARITILTLLTMLASGAWASDLAPAHEQPAKLRLADITAKDLKAIHYVENAHGQLDEWSARLIARLERGQGARHEDPVLDGRARFQIQKLRVTYAGYTHHDALITAINLLADAHEQRLDALDLMLDNGIDRERYREASAEVDDIIGVIRNWREQQ